MMIVKFGMNIKNAFGRICDYAKTHFVCILNNM